MQSFLIFLAVWFIAQAVFAPAIGKFIAFRERQP